MKYSYNLHGFRPVEGAAAKQIWEELCAAGMAQGNCWTYWCCSKQLGSIDISIATISVLFKFEDLGRDAYFSIMQTATATATKNADPWNKENPNNVIYRRMLDAAKSRNSADECEEA